MQLADSLVQQQTEDDHYSIILCFATLKKRINISSAMVQQFCMESYIVILPPVEFAKL